MEKDQATTVVSPSVEVFTPVEAINDNGEEDTECYSEHDLSAGKEENLVEKKYKKFCMFKVEEKKYVLTLFTLINIFLFADQNLLAPNLTVIADEFNMTDNERDMFLGGYIPLGFFAVGGCVALVVGYLADTINRKWTFAAVVVLGELSCMATYWVPTGSEQQFWLGLWLTRTLTGIALGGAVPIQFSIFGDYFTPKERGKAVAGLSIAIGLGAGGGQMIAGYLSPDWRTPFLLVSIPAFLLVLVYVVTTTEPTRGGGEVITDEDGNKIVIDENITWEKFKSLMVRPTVLLIYLQSIFGILPWGVALVFLNDFLNVEKELEAYQSANVITAWGLSLAVSAVFTGWFTDILYQKRMKTLPLIAGISTIIAPFPMLYVVKSPPQSVYVYAAVFVPSGLITGIAGIIIKTLLFGVTIPETRGTAYAIQSLVDEIGKGIGPFIASLIIVAVGNRTDGITYAMLMWVPCGLTHLVMYFTLERDVKQAADEMLEYHRRKREAPAL